MKSSRRAWETPGKKSTKGKPQRSSALKMVCWSAQGTMIKESEREGDDLSVKLFKLEREFISERVAFLWQGNVPQQACLMMKAKALGLENLEKCRQKSRNQSLGDLSTLVSTAFTTAKVRNHPNVYQQTPGFLPCGLYLHRCQVLF